MDKTDTYNYLYRIAQENDQEAFEKLYCHYFGALFRFCLSIIRTKEPAEEIVDDVFMNLWKRREHLHKIENLNVYLYVAVKNKALDHLSKDHLQPSVDITAIHSDDHITFDISPEQLVISRETITMINKAVEQLPPRCRLIFKLVKEDGLKYKEVASILNVSIKTVEAQLTIAVKKLSTAIMIASGDKVGYRNNGNG
jgi:RNA polymerase sigma-70 factor (ECF subfamily)